MAGSFSFSGAGFMGIYHLGAFAALKKHAPRAFFHPSTSTFLGASAGSLISVAIVCDVHEDDIANLIFQVAASARKHRFGVLSPGCCLLTEMEKGMKNLVPEDAHLRAAGRVHIGITDTTKLVPSNERMQRGLFANKRITEFDTTQDLVDAALCSSYIPGITGKTTRLYKGKKGYIDGGLTDNWPRLDAKTVVVSPFIGAFSFNETYPYYNEEGTVSTAEDLEANLDRMNEDEGLFIDKLNLGQHPAICPSCPAGITANIPFQCAEVSVNGKQMHMVKETLFPPDQYGMQKVYNSAYNDMKKFLA